MTTKGILITVAVALALLALSFWGGIRYAESRPQEVQRDTVEVVRIDTFRVERPVYVERRVVDTLLVAVRDTVSRADTVWMPLPLERVVYRDTAYLAVVSGYRPRLDAIEVYQRDVVRTVTERVEVPVSRRWGLGITAGYGAAAVGGSVQLAPFIGVGVSYNIVCW